MLNINQGMIGEIRMFADSATPSGWLTCDGSAISRITYSNLFSIIGVNYGSGDGSTTFNLPDLRGRTPIGEGTGTGLTSRSIGSIGGEERHTLSVSELPSHTHDYLTRGDRSVDGAGGDQAADAFEYATASSPAGSNQSHNNMQPFSVVKFIIKF